MDPLSDLLRFVGQMLRAHTSVVPLPKGLPSPLAWGDLATVHARFGSRVRELTGRIATLEFRFPFAPEAVVERFATCYGPTIATLAATDPAGGSALRRAITPSEWQLRLPHDGRKVGVLVHHVATMSPLEIKLAYLLADGKPIEGVTWEDHAVRHRYHHLARMQGALAHARAQRAAA